MSARRRDILSALPLELTVRISSFLGVEDLVRFRRVSKQWLGLVLSEPIMSQLMRLWDPADTLSLSIPKRIKPAERSRLILDHIEAFQSGRASQLSTWDIKMKGGNHPDKRLIVYGGGYIAWVNRNIYRAVQVLHLPTRTQAKVEIPYQCAIQLTHIAISETMICVVDNRFNCRIKLHSEKTWLPPFELKPFDWLTLTARKKIVALFGGKKDADVNSQLVVWNITTRKSKTTFFKRPANMTVSPSNLSLEVRISGDEQFVTAFYASMHQLFVYRVTIEDSAISSTLTRLYGEEGAPPDGEEHPNPRPVRELRTRSDREYFAPILYYDYLPPVNPDLLDPQALNTGGDWITIRAYIAMQPWSGSKPIFQRLQYLAAANKLRLSEVSLQNIAFSTETDNISFYDKDSGTDVLIDHEMNSLLMFKDTAYFWVHSPLGLRLHILSLETGLVKPAPMGAGPVQEVIMLNGKTKLTMAAECHHASRNRGSAPEKHYKRTGGMEWWSELHGDENYLVNVNLESLYAWSFDEHGGMGSFCCDSKGDAFENNYNGAIKTA